MTEITFNGSNGRIEARYYHSNNEKNHTALILPGHPSKKCHMNDKITYTLFHAFITQGFSVMRMNYRGIGFSQGEFEDGEGELSDAAAAIDLLNEFNEDIKSIWVAGYDFGSWVGMQMLMRRPEVKNFISVSPPVGKYDFSFLSPCPASGLIITPEKDPHTNEEKIKKLIKNLKNQKGLSIKHNIIPNANEIFENQLKKLHQNASMYILQKIQGLK